MVDIDRATLLSFLLKDMPYVCIRKKFRNTSLLIVKMVFAFTRGDGMVMKLPNEKIKELVDKENPEPIVMGKRVLKRNERMGNINSQRPT
jgi:hypothetical protein